jgi:mannose-6-phosphate isomerase-like protein (cupin superfamily)
MRKVNLAEKFSSFNEWFSPKIVGELNGQHVKLVKLRGDFPWHQHEDADELFLVVRGRFRMDYRDDFGRESAIDLNEGELLIVPRGMEHRPSAASEVEVLLFEPAGTLNTGNVRASETVECPEWI